MLSINADGRLITSNTAELVPCPQHDALDAGCPLYPGVWLCGTNPCVIAKSSLQSHKADAIALLETEIEFISGDCGSIDLNVVARKLREAVRLLQQ